MSKMRVELLIGFNFCFWAEFLGEVAGYRPVHELGLLGIWGPPRHRPNPDHVKTTKYPNYTKLRYAVTISCQDLLQVAIATYCTWSVMRHATGPTPIPPDFFSC